MPTPDLTTIRAGAQERLAAARLYVDDTTDADVRFIASVLDLIDAQEAADAEAQAAINDILDRRADGRPHEIEATTARDIEMLNAIRQDQRPLVRSLIRTIGNVWRDFGNGRCSVCGMTTAQAVAAGYDCAEEC